MTDADLDFPLEQGGPVWRLWLKVGLAPATPVPLGRRALVGAGLCWLPLLAFSLVDGLATNHSISVPFLRDIAAHARFIAGIVLLVLADAAISGRLREGLRQFPAAGLLAPGAEVAFLRLVTRGRRRVESTAVELVLLGLAYAGSSSSVRRELGNGISTWQALASDGGESLTRAGWWYALVSLPLFQFLLLRWLFRTAVWAELLVGISRLDLRLVPTHPDRAAGLGFLSIAQSGFAILVLAASTSLAAVIADEVLYHGAELESFYPTVAAFGVVMLLVVVAPLLAFGPRLARLKRESLHAYGALSSRHDASFAAKWLAPGSSPPLGDPDPSSLQDLATGGYERVKAMRLVPVDALTIAPVLFAAALPMLPLVAIKVPLVEILKGLLRVVM